MVLVVTWYNGHDHHVEHVVEEQGDADGDEHELPLVLGLLHDYGHNNKGQKVMSLGWQCASLVPSGKKGQKPPEVRPTIPGAQRPMPARDMIRTAEKKFQL